MNKLLATTIAFGTLVLGVIVGIYFGAGAAQKVCQAQAALFDMSNAQTMSRYAAVTLAMGSPDASERALQEYLRALDTREKLDIPAGFVSPTALTMDKALTYARLALLAKTRNDPVGAATYWSQAQALCPILQWTSCTADDLTAVVRQLDEHSIWGIKPPAAEGHGS
jgi:hypothetical protein